MSKQKRCPDCRVFMEKVEDDDKRLYFKCPECKKMIEDLWRFNKKNGLDINKLLHRLYSCNGAYKLSIIRENPLVFVKVKVFNENTNKTYKGEGVWEKEAMTQAITNMEKDVKKWEKEDNDD